MQDHGAGGVSGQARPRVCCQAEPWHWVCAEQVARRVYLPHAKLLDAMGELTLVAIGAGSGARKGRAQLGLRAQRTRRSFGSEVKRGS